MTPRLLSAADLAVHYQVAVSTIHVWASRYRWPKYGTRRHRLYDLDDVQATYDQLHPRKAN